MKYEDVEWLETATEHCTPQLRARIDRIQREVPVLQALLAEHRLLGLLTPWLQLDDQRYWPFESMSRYVPIRIFELLERRPKSLSDRVDRTLANVARSCRHAGEWVPVESSKAEQLTFSQRSDEALYVLDALKNDACLEIEGRTANGGARLRVTPRGWMRFAEMSRDRRDSREKPAFVAMWFGSEEAADQESESCPSFTPNDMNEVYQRGMKRGIESAGYRCERVDLVHHIDFVMDKVLGMIRVAPFVVADFTGKGNGVYFEAGFARGLGIPVIHTCHKTHFEHAHFDIKQINTIVWEQADDLSEKLLHRILGTLGQGPHSDLARGAALPLNGDADSVG